MTTAMAVMSLSAAASSTATATATATRTLFVGQRNNSFTLRSRKPKVGICCEVALRSDSSSIDLDSSSSASEDLELKSCLDKVGCKVKVKAPLKVYHVPKIPELELTPNMVGVVKQYVGFWKGKRISPNLPFKVQFNVDVPDRGPVKFFVHLKEDEFEIIS